MHPTHRLRPSRLKPLLLPLLGFPLIAGSAHATALTGDFGLNNWTLTRTINSAVNSTFTYGSTGDYYCNSGAVGMGSLACVLNPVESANPANFGVVGSDNPDIGSPNDQVNIAWSMTYSGPSGTLGFDFGFDTADTTASDFGFFSINGTPIINTSSIGISPFTGTLNNGDIISFGVYTTDNKGSEGYVEITNFQFTANVDPVPAPLPALGGLAAWGWSKRLRSRIRLASLSARLSA